MDWFSLGSAAIGGLGSLLGGSSSNKAAAKAAQAQMDFQERMAKNAHQYEVADLRAAGLNPILSGTGGMGAATPSGASYSPSDVVTPATEQTRKSLETSSARDLMKMQEDVAVSTSEKNRSEADLYKAKTVTEQNQPENIASAAALNRAQIPKIGAEIPQIESATIKTQQDTATAKQAEKLLVENQLTEKKRQMLLGAEAAATKQMEHLNFAKTEVEQIQKLIRNMDFHTAKAVAQEAVNKGKISEGAGGQLLTIINRVSNALQGK
ncbi:MAG: DNA pilot protein [Microviridae sp.]|nr:MAG: DNA pilot protein [Microviridae sp.]